MGEEISHLSSKALQCISCPNLILYSALIIQVDTLQDEYLYQKLFMSTLFWLFCNCQSSIYGTLEHELSVATLHIYSYKVFCYYWIGASLQLGVQQLTELPEWTKHASTVHCTVQLYSTTIVLLSTAVQHNTIAQYYSTNTQYNTTARHYSTTVLIVPTLNTNLIT